MIVRSYCGHGLLLVASAFARVGRAVLGRPETTLAAAAPAGAREVVLSSPIARFTPALRIDGSMSSVMMVGRVRGATVQLKDPLPLDYAAGSVVKVLL